MGTFLYRVFTFIAFFFVASGIISVLLMEFGNDNGSDGLIAGLPIVLPFIVASPLIYLMGWTIRWVSGAPAKRSKRDRNAMKRSLPGVSPSAPAASRPKPAEQIAPLGPPPR